MGNLGPEIAIIPNNLGVLGAAVFLVMVYNLKVFDENKFTVLGKRN